MTKSIKVDASVQNFDRVKEFVLQIIGSRQCDELNRSRILVAIEEVFVNISSYAYEGGGGSVEITADLAPDMRGRLEITFKDTGKPFDPLKEADPDIHRDGTLRPPGGMGIYLVKNTMDDVRYSYADGRNCLKICHHLVGH